MQAAILYGREDVRVEDVSPKALGPGEVRVRIQAALTCGTDLKVFKRGYHARMIVPPAGFGHEFAGVIEEVRPAKQPTAATGSQPVEAGWCAGDRVVAANSAPCGRCIYCLAGQENLCEDLLFLNGAYAESIVVPARLVEKNLLRLQPGTAFRDAALVEPLACAVQGIEDTQLRANQRVLVLGAGPIGLMFVALARQAGCRVVVAGRGATRLTAAHNLGAGEVIDVAGVTDTAACVRDVIGAGFDAVIEAVGKPELWEAALRLVRKGGTVNFFGGCPSGTAISLDTTLMHYSSLKLLASFHHTPRTVRRALGFIESGLIRAADFVTGECALSQLPQLFKTMAVGNRAIKTLVHMRS